jgi:hypothetical protein
MPMPQPRCAAGKLLGDDDEGHGRARDDEGARRGLQKDELQRVLAEGGGEGQQSHDRDRAEEQRSAADTVGERDDEQRR